MAIQWHCWDFEKMERPSRPRANNTNNLVVSECFWLFLIVFAVFGKHMDGMHPLSSTWFEPLRDEYRPHPGNRTERKRSGPSWPKADLGQTWPSLALSWAEQEPTWAQLGPNLRRTLASWPQLRGHLAPKLGPRQANVGNMALHEPPSKQQKIVGNSSENASFESVALSPQNWPRLGPAWARAAPQKTQLEPKSRKVASATWVLRASAQA